MSFKKIKQQNIIHNTLLTYPKVSFNIFSGSIYNNISNTVSVPASNGFAAVEDNISGSS